MTAKITKEKIGVPSLVGELLKRKRESMDLSQKQISDKLGYPYFNFISMIENGASKIPLARIADVVKAYGLPQGAGREPGRL